MRAFLAGIALLTLAACAGGEQGPPPTEQLQAAAFRAPGPAKITLITVINNRSGAGGHSALLVSGSQRVLFDPAGSFRHPTVTEYGDVLYGMTDNKIRFYKSAHARTSHHVVTQEITVTPEVAEQALALVQAQGRVASAFCTNSTSGILRQLPGFSDVSSTFFPDRLMDQIALRDDVTTDRYYENDQGDVVDAVTAQAAAIAASQ